MVWVVAKIIGDGQTLATAFRSVVHEFPVKIRNECAIPVDLKTGRPTAAFCLIELSAEDAALVAKAGCQVLSDSADMRPSAKALLAAGLAEQGAALSLDGATDVSAVLDLLRAQIPDQA